MIKNTRCGNLLGALRGIKAPFGSASMVAVAMGMVEMKIPAGMNFSFLLSAPVCNFMVIGVIWGVFGWIVTLLYFAITFGGAVIEGWILGKTSIQQNQKQINFKNYQRLMWMHGGSSVMVDPSLPSASCCSNISAEQSNDCCTPRNSCFGGVATNVNPPIGISCHRERVIDGLFFPYINRNADQRLPAAFIAVSIVERYLGNEPLSAIPIVTGIGVALYMRIEMAVLSLKVCWKKE